jgi:hypothetical protein
VTSTHAGPVSQLDAVLPWAPLEADTGIVGAVGPITGAFPAKVSLERLAPPLRAKQVKDPNAGQDQPGSHGRHAVSEAIGRWGGV